MSKKDRKWLFWIEEMLESIRKIRETSHGLSFEDYFSDYTKHDIINLNIGNIGEYARHVPKDVQERHPDIPWRDMIGMRNFIFHEYPGLDMKAVWRVVTDDLDLLEKALQTILKNEDRG